MMNRQPNQDAFPSSAHPNYFHSSFQFQALMKVSLFIEQTDFQQSDKVI